MSASATTTDREIVVTRVYDAPRGLVFDAFTDPKHISQWWGPRGFTTTTHSMDFRVDGEWRYTMHGPDGTDYKNLVVYHEIERPERLVYTHGSEMRGEAGEFHVTITLFDQGGKTRLTMHSVFASPAELERVKKFGAVEGGKQTLDRLAELLATR